MEMLQWVGTGASAEKERVNLLFSFWNVEEEHWRYQINIMISCRDLNILNVKIWLFFYN